MHKIDITVQGHHCNDWPGLKVMINGQVMYSGQVEDTQLISLQFTDPLDNNALTFVHHGKQFGDQGIYDTDTTLGLDRGITIKDIQFDGVTIGEHKINQLEFETEWTPNQLSTLDPDFICQRNRFECNGYMGFNGCINLKFWTPVMEWLTVFKYKVERITDIAYFSGYDRRWHYDEDIKLIKEIKELMDFE